MRAVRQAALLCVLTSHEADLPDIVDMTTADATMCVQAVRWARNTRLLVAMVRQCSAEAELAQTEARHPSLSCIGSCCHIVLLDHRDADGINSAQEPPNCTAASRPTDRLSSRHRSLALIDKPQCLHLLPILPSDWPFR